MVAMKTLEPRFFLPLLTFAILFSVQFASVPVHASSAGPDTVKLSLSTVSQTTPASFTQDVLISYSANAAGAFPKTVSMQYVIQYDSAVIDVDNSACAASSDGNTYCGVTAGAYAQSFVIQQLPQNNPCGANFCANVQPVSGTIMQIFVASIATLSPSGGIAVAGGVHSTIHWRVTASSSTGGSTSIHFSGPDTFYSTSSTSAIDPSSSQIFYTPTNGQFTLAGAPTPTLVSVVVGTDGALYGSSFTGTWGPFTSLQGSSPSAP